MKKLSILGLGLMFLTAARVLAFSDLDESSFPVSVHYVYENGIVAGYSDGTFKPQKKINRAEFTKIIVLSKYGEEEIGERSDCFYDVGKEWFAKYVCFAKTHNIISGYPDGNFYPAKEINLVEALKIIIETYDFSYASLTHDQPWYEPYYEAAIDNSILFDEEGRQLNISAAKMLLRDEAALFISNTHEKLGLKTNDNSSAANANSSSIASCDNLTLTLNIVDENDKIITYLPVTDSLGQTWAYDWENTWLYHGNGVPDNGAYHFAFTGRDDYADNVVDIVPTEEDCRQGEKLATITLMSRAPDLSSKEAIGVASRVRKIRGDFSEPSNSLYSETVEKTSGQANGQFPAVYAAMMDTYLEDLTYCFDLAPRFIGVYPAYDQIGLQYYVSTDESNQGYYSGLGNFNYKRSEENAKFDYQDILKDSPDGFLYRSSPTYCANAHEFTHFVVDGLGLPDWANEGIAEYTQKYIQPGLKLGAACRAETWYGMDYWDTEEMREFPYADLSQSDDEDLTSNQAGPKWYNTARCQWELFDEKFDYTTRHQIFVQLAENEKNGLSADFIQVMFDIVGSEREQELEDHLTVFGFKKGEDY